MSKVKDFFKGWSKFELCWLVLSTVIMIVLSIIWGDNTLALISGITGILGVVLAAKGKVSTYFFATINVAIYAYLTFNNHLYGEFMLNAFYYIPMNFIGFYLWSRHKDEKSGEVEGKALTPKQIVILLAATAVIVIIYWQILTHLGGQLALIDAMSTVFSVIAMRTMGHSFLEAISTANRIAAKVVSVKGPIITTEEFENAKQDET